MARIKTRLLSEIASPGALTAATTPVQKTSTPKGNARGVNKWAEEAWAAYDRVGELRYVCQWLANSLSRVSITANIIGDDGQPGGPANDDLVVSIVRDIAGGPAGQSQLLARLATFLTVPGEGWIAVLSRINAHGEATEEWHVLSTDEVRRQRANDIVITLDDGTEHQFNPDRDILTRVYRPHPRDSREADSPVRAALPILNEITRTSEAIDGASRSRLAGNGILLLPQEISMPVARPPRHQSDAPGLDDEPEMVDESVTAHDVMAQLQQVMTTAIRDHSSAASMVPIVLKAPGDMLDKIKHLRFESDITDTNLATRDRAITRLSRSLDVPPEILMGTADSNHWSAWQVDEAAVKSHIEPMMVLICDALTESLLRPLLRVSGHPHPERFTVWYDATALTQRPNRSSDAQAAYDAGAITADVYRRELGFTDGDAPADVMGPGEQRQLAQRLVARAPSLLPHLAHIIGLDPPPGGWGAIASDTGTGPATPPTPNGPPGQ